MTLGAGSPASAHYNGNHGFHLYIGTPWPSAYSYDYLSSCSCEPRLVIIRVPNGYGGYYFKTVVRDVKPRSGE